MFIHTAIDNLRFDVKAPLIKNNLVEHLYIVLTLSHILSSHLWYT